MCHEPPHTVLLNENHSSYADSSNLDPSVVIQKFVTLINSSSRPPGPAFGRPEDKLRPGPSSAMDTGFRRYDKVVCCDANF